MKPSVFSTPLGDWDIAHTGDAHASIRSIAPQKSPQCPSTWEVPKTQSYSVISSKTWPGLRLASDVPWAMPGGAETGFCPSGSRRFRATDGKTSRLAFLGGSGSFVCARRPNTVVSSGLPTRPSPPGRFPCQHHAVLMPATVQ